MKLIKLIERLYTPTSYFRDRVKDVYSTAWCTSKRYRSVSGSFRYEHHVCAVRKRNNGAARMSVIGVGRTQRKAWKDAYKNMIRHNSSREDVM